MMTRDWANKLAEIIDDNIGDDSNEAYEIRQKQMLNYLTADLEDQDLIELWQERAEVLKEGNDSKSQLMQYE